MRDETKQGNKKRGQEIERVEMGGNKEKGKEKSGNKGIEWNGKGTKEK